LRGHDDVSSALPASAMDQFREANFSLFHRRELSERISKDSALSGVSVLGLDPGAMPSNLGERGTLVLRIIFKAFMPLVNPVMSKLKPNGMLRTTAQSATDVIRAAFDSRVLGEKPNGVYMDGSAISDVGAEAKDKRKRERLWLDSVTWAGIHNGDTVLENWT
jgi:hypothetical protein